MGKVVCIKDYKKNGQEFWSSGEIYDAEKLGEERWNIETNSQGYDSVGDWIPFFDDYFIDVTDGITLMDAVIFAYRNGYFKVTSYSDNGCGEIHFSFEKNTDAYGELTDDYYFYNLDVDADVVCETLTKAIKSMIEDETFPEDAYEFLCDMLKICRSKNGNNAFENIIRYWMNKALSKRSKDEKQALGDILKTLGSETPFLDKVEIDEEGRVRPFTESGAKAYGKLTEILYTVGELTDTDMDAVIEELDNVASASESN